MSPSHDRSRFTRLKEWWFNLKTWQQFVLAGVLLAGLIGLVSIAEGNEREASVSSSGNAPTQPASDDTTTTATDTCSAFGDNVEAYDILAPSASRGEYLTLLHRLQRDCPDEAERRALTNEGAPECERLDQENCTMYRQP